MFKVFFNIILSILDFLKIPILITLGVLAIFYLVIGINIIIGLCKGKRLKKGEHKKIKKHGFFRKIFIDLPHQFTEDMFNKDPDEFRL